MRNIKSMQPILLIHKLLLSILFMKNCLTYIYVDLGLKYGRTNNVIFEVDISPNYALWQNSTSLLVVRIYLISPKLHMPRPK